MGRTRGKKKDAESSCSVCQQPDSQQMVQCDACDGWFHFECVGVDEGISDKDWMCTKCSSASTANTNSDENVTDYVENEGEIFQSPMNVNEDEMRKIGKGVTSKGSVKHRRNLDMKLQRLEEEHRMNLLFVKQKYALMSTYDDSGDSESDVSNVTCRQQLNYGNRENVNEVLRAGAEYGRAEGGVQSNISAPNPTATQMHAGVYLRQDQIYSRQIIPRELPVFSGKPEEWPLFISSYENSTRMCGFSNDENLLRLQRALRGKALEYVSSKLTLPALVPEVITTLRMLFGRPENIIHNLLVKLRAGPNVNANKLDTLVHFSLDVKNIVATMEAANLHAHLCNPMMIQEFIERLPAQMRLDWAVHSRQLNMVTLTEFSNWLFKLADAASSVMTILVPSSNTQDNEKRRAPRVNVHDERTNYDENIRKRSSGPKCFGCDATGHFIAQCEKFKKLDYNEKWNIIHEKKLCRLCLKVHDPKFCRERKVCNFNNCIAKHHPLLHKPEAIKDDNKNTNMPVVAVHRMMTSNILYRIVPIKIYGDNTSVNEYAFLDEGSGPTLIEKSVLEKLDIQGTRSELCLRWTDGTVRIDDDSEQTDLKISPSGNSARQFLLKNVRSVSKLDLPRQTLIFDELVKKYKHLRGIPVKSYENVIPRIIIGLNNRNVAMPLKSKEGGSDEPAALKTRLGWTIYGISGPEAAVSTNMLSNVSLQLHICECGNDASLERLMKRNIQLENEGVESKIHAENDDSKLQNYVLRTGDKFTVKLLWKSENLSMPGNYEMALRRLICFERRLEKDNDLKNRVNDHIADMLRKGYVRKLNAAETDKQYPRKWYLPIFVVRNPNKPEKIRIVWDAVAEHLGVSLNGHLDKGPDLLRPLINVLFNFRIGKIGISADISEMFHRVAVDEEDTQSQRFLWRDCINAKQPNVFVLQVMSFGASCSPSLAQYVKNNNAKDFENEFPRAVNYGKTLCRRYAG